MDNNHLPLQKNPQDSRNPQKNSQDSYKNLQNNPQKNLQDSRGDLQNDLQDSKNISQDSKNPPRESEKTAESNADSAKSTRLRSIIVGAKGLSLGISIVVAILLGVGVGILMQKIFNVTWVLFLGVLWGVLAAFLNVYKVYKAELRDFEKIAKNPKYQKR